MESKVIRILLQIITIALILGGAVSIYKWLIKTRPEPVKVPIEKSLPAVEVTKAAFTSPPAAIRTQGEVIPPKRTTIAAQVMGKITSVADNYEIGARFAEGEVILTLEDIDYQTALVNAKASKTTAQAAIKDAQVALQLEQARVEQAKRDWAKLGKGRQASDLLLRKPQIEAAEAKIVSAQANLTQATANIEQAQRNLERTRIRAPYDCLIEQKQIDLGALVTVGLPLLSVYEHGRVEARLPISLEDLPLVTVSDAPINAQAQIGGESKKWTGKIIRNENRIDPTSRTAYVVAGFEGPDLPPVGMFVNVALSGKPLENVIEIPRIGLRGGNQVIIITPDNTLTFREVSVARTTDQQVYLAGGVEEGELICTTVITSPIEGMQVSVAEGKPKD